MSGRRKCAKGPRRSNITTSTCLPSVFLPLPRLSIHRTDKAKGGRRPKARHGQSVTCERGAYLPIFPHNPDLGEQRRHRHGGPLPEPHVTFRLQAKGVLKESDPEDRVGVFNVEQEQRLLNSLVPGLARKRPSKRLQTRSTSAWVILVSRAIEALMTPGIANTAKGSVYMVQMVPWVFPSSSFPCQSLSRPSRASPPSLARSVSPPGATSAPNRTGLDHID